MAPRKMMEAALKPTKKIMKTRFRCKRMEEGILRKIRNDQECIREEQRKIRGMLMEVKKQYHLLKKEEGRIMKRTARAQAKVVIMFRILKARERGDFIVAAGLTQFLRDFVADENAIVNLADMINEPSSSNGETTSGVTTTDQQLNPKCISLCIT